MDRVNCYLLLELDPAEADQARIEIQLRSKQVEWSREKNHPTRGRQAQHKLEQLREIRRVMLDPVLREEEARQAAEIHAELRKGATRELDDAIDVAAASGYMIDTQVTELSKRFAGRFTEAEIRQRIKVDVRPDIKANRPQKPTIDITVARQIADRLKIVRKKDLYDFLERPPTSSLLVLHCRASDLYAAAINNNNKTAEVTAQAELAGHCSRLFSNEDEQQRYDNTLDQQRLAELEPLIETAGATGMISAVAMEQLLRKAREAGLATDETRQYVRDFAIKRKWSVEVPQASKVERLLRCGSCRTLNEENARSCGCCGARLQVECPRCKAINPSENRACKDCGFSVGDHWTVRRLLREAELAVAQGSMHQALRQLREAKVYWPDSQEVESRLAEVFKWQEEERRLAETLRTAIADRRLCEAEKQLIELQQRGLMVGDIEALSKNIVAGLSAAKKLVEHAKAVERAGNSNEAVRAYLNALNECTDYRDAAQGLGKHPPDSPRDANAVAASRVITVIWRESPSIGQIRYRVVRKEGSEPRAIADGKAVGETAAMSLNDPEAVPGEIYYYAVFSDRGGTTSPQASIAGPVLRLAEVTQLTATGSDGRVSLSWEPPGRARAIEVYRKEGAAPQGRGDGMRLGVVALTGAADSDLRNGTLYSYRVITIFDGCDGKPLYSEGTTISAVPTPLPEPIKDLSVVRQKRDFEAFWTPVRVGEVQIFAGTVRPSYRCGQMLPVSSLGELGKPLTRIAPGTVRGALESRLLYLTPVTVSGLTAVIGQSVVTTWVDDVEELSVTVAQDVLTARWKWPPGIDTVMVAVRCDQFPTGASDDRAVRETCSRFQYDRQGGYRKSIVTQARLFLTVYAMIRRDGEWQIASGTSPGARKEILACRYCVMKYRIRPKSGWFRLGGSDEHVLELVTDSAARLPELLLVVKSEGMPLSPDQGKVVLRIPAGTACFAKAPLAWRFRVKDESKRWRARLFPTDEGACDWLNLIDDT